MKEKEREKLLQLVAGTRVGRGEKGNKIKEKKKETDPYLEERNLEEERLRCYSDFA